MIAIGNFYQAVLELSNTFDISKEEAMFQIRRFCLFYRISDLTHRNDTLFDYVWSCWHIFTHYMQTSPDGFLLPSYGSEEFRKMSWKLHDTCHIDSA